MAEQDPERFQRAGARWHARFVLEAQKITLAESQMLLGAVAALTGTDREIAATLIAGYAKRYSIANVERALRRK
jgi:hypothetical protein